MCPTHDAPTPPTLTAGGLERVREGWARQLSMPVEALSSAGTRFFARDGATAVVVVELGAARVVLATQAAIAQLEDLDDDLLLDVRALASRLEHFQPRPVGAATLSYTDTRPGRRLAGRIEPADPQMVETFRVSCHDDEWDESGLMEMPHRWAALTPEGHLAALAGFERWGCDIAQLGVAADPAQRGRGYAAVAAQAAMAAAVDQGLVAQWRCRIGNERSARLGDSLGFARLGRQTAVLLGPAVTGAGVGV